MLQLASFMGVQVAALRAPLLGKGDKSAGQNGIYFDLHTRAVHEQTRGRVSTLR